MFENKKKTVWIISIIMLLLIPTTGVLAREFAASTSAVAPQSESSECGTDFDYALKFEGNDRVDGKQKTAHGNTITIKNFTYKDDIINKDEILTFDWTATVGIGKVVVKAGNNGGYTQLYNNATSGSEATLNNKGLSHVTFCWNEPEDEESSVNVNVGACSWTEQGGSFRSVSLTITGASVTITKTGGGTYGPFTASQNINLPAGSYTYEYTATTGYTGSGNGTFPVDACPAASASAIPQVCEWDTTSETSSTDVILTISNATLTIYGPNSYEQSFSTSDTINLSPGSYTYSWTANPGYSGSGNGTFTLDDCEPKVGSADVEIGGCEWNAANGSLITVTITLEDASLTIDGQTYTDSTDIKLPPGTYAYSWEGTGDYEGGDDGSITIYGCEPASVTIDPDVCDWVNEVSMNDVILSISGATLTVYQNTVEVGTYSSSQTITLPAGEYTYEWTANTNYTGSGSGSFTLIDCEPGKGAATVNIGACEWDATASGSLINVVITLENAALTIDGETYIASTEIKLSPGTYAYSWVATGDNEGSDEGSITIYGCEPASVIVDPDVCEWVNEVSMNDVILNISGATLTIYQDSALVGTYTSSQTISLSAGEYTYEWTALENFTGTGSGTFTLIDCEPGKGDASVDVGACEWDATNGSMINVNISLVNAALTIDGDTYTESTEIKLSPGTYAYSWVSTGDNEGSGDGSITIYGCEPASVTVDLGGCEWDEEKSVTDITLTISGATLTIFQAGVEVDTYTSSQTISLPEGEYTYAWEAIDENYTGSGSGSFTLVNCEPGIASAAVSLGACVFSNNNSLTPITVTLNFAVLTIDGETYTESTTIQLEPGNYAYSWIASDEEHEGEGSGTLIVDDCGPKDEEDPKEEKAPDPVTDVAAGGQGPSLFSIFTPVIAAFTGLLIAWIVLKNKVMKIN